MRLTASLAFRLAAAFGFLGVALGAFGAHALREILTQRHAAAIWETAVFYHLLHAAVMLGLAARRPFSAVAWTSFALGIALFSGSLYAYALLGAFWLVFVTPLGGACFLAGWSWLVWRGGAEE